MKEKYLIIGNDKRQEALAKMYGVEPVSPDNKELNKLINKSDIIILPLTGAEIYVRPRIEPDGARQIVINREKILADKDFAAQNATPTAEGSILLALGKSEKTLRESYCLVLGHGNCGKEITKLLKAFGAKVDIFDKEIDEMNKNLSVYDIIFNTIPEQVLSNEQIKQSADQIVINIASHNAGFPKENRFEAIPAKCFPATAAKIMKEAIDRIVGAQGSTSNSTLDEPIVGARRVRPRLTNSNAPTKSTEEGVENVQK